MAITLIDKIKPKNNGAFPLVDAEDVLMPDGTRLSEAEFGGQQIAIDSELSETSENPVQNKVVTGAFNDFAQVCEQVFGELTSKLPPDVTEEDNGKFLQAVDGAWVAVDAVRQVTAIVNSRIDSMFVPLSQDEYDALVEAGTVEEGKYYLIVG